MRKLLYFFLLLSFVGFGFEWDFENDRPKVSWWALHGQKKQHSIEFATNPQTGKQALLAKWDGDLSTWMHVYSGNMQGLDEFKCAKFTFKLATSETSKLRAVTLRIQDKDLETFYFRRRVRWKQAGRWTVEYIVDPANLAYTSSGKHGKIANGKLDFPLHGFGVTLEVPSESGRGEVFIENMKYVELDEVPPPPELWTLERLDKELLANPPARTDYMVRSEILDEMDRILSVPKSEDDPKIADFYNMRIMRAIEEIKQWDSPKAKLWKFYSSGVAIKYGGKVVAFDINDGVILGRDHKVRRKLELYPETVDALADVIDEMYYTHEHCDHVGRRVSNALFDKGKTIYACAATIKYWGWEGKPGLIVAEKHQAKGYHCYDSFQWMSETFKIQNVCYVLELGPKLTVMARGDMYKKEDIDGFIAWIKERKLHIDVALLNTQWSIIGPCKENWDSFFIPLHEWEFTHRRYGTGGAATQSYAIVMNTYGTLIDAGKCEILAWGEGTLLTD